MTLKSASSLCVFAFTAFTMLGQAPRPTLRPAPTVVAGIPVNYDQSKVGTYTLPDALKLNNGKEVRDAKSWFKKRRPEIVHLFETQQYGIAPGRPADESFEIVDKGTPALNGKAIRKEINIHLSKDPSWPVIHLLNTFLQMRKSRCQCFSALTLEPYRMLSAILALHRRRSGARRPTLSSRRPRAGALDA